MKQISFLIIALLIFSCGTEQSKKTGGNEKIPAGIEVVDDSELREIISNRKGKVLFLNIWATWCVPCVEEFPSIVKLDKNYSSKNVEIIALSVDLPADINDKILPFLKEQKTGFKVYVAEEKSSDEIINMLNPEWSGAIPASIVFDVTGKKKKFLLGAQSYRDMALCVDSVISL